MNNRKQYTRRAAARAPIIALVLAATGCALPPEPAPNDSTAEIARGQTLTGQSIRLPDFSETTRKRLETDLAIAQAVFEVAPHREDSYIWLGRRLGYLGRYPEAIDVFSQGLAVFPDSYKLYRFRGRHRARNRDFSGAIADYKMGLAKIDGLPDSFEPDGIPNAIGLTISTYRNNLHYYLGQTSFAVGDYQQMYDELEKSLQSPISLPIEDHKVAVVFWQYIALMKQGETARAAAHLQTIPAEIDLIENTAYHRAVLVLQNKISTEEALNNEGSLAKFAVGMMHVFAGNEEAGHDVLQALVDENPLGYWPAEAELTR